MGIGEGSVIRRAIIDKNARIGRNVQIINKDNVQEAERDAEGYYIRSGIVVIIKNAVIPDGHHHLEVSKGTERMWSKLHMFFL